MTDSSWLRRRVAAALLLALVLAASLLVSAVSRKEPFDGAAMAGNQVPQMSTGMSVPRPRLPGLDVSDSALMAGLLHEASIAFAFIGPDGFVGRMNQAMESLLGGEADQASKGAIQAWPPDLAAAAQAAIACVAAGDRPVPQTEHAFAAPPGDGAADAAAQPRYYWSFSWFPSKDGEVSGVGTFAVEVTRQHQAAEALRRSEERYRSLVQAGAQRVCVPSPHGDLAQEQAESLAVA